MSERTGIEWADSTWSPWRGCTKISEGCAHCYAETMSHRNPAVFGSWGKGAPRVKNKDWRAPLGWNAGRRVCPKCGTYVHADSCRVCIDQTPTRRLRIFPSLCDWLDDEVPIEWLAEFLALIHATPQLDWLLLTKRPESFERVRMIQRDHAFNDRLTNEWLREWVKEGHAPSNVWFGVSVENQRRADERIPQLLQIPAALRWVSLEPLIGPVDLEQINDGSWYDKEGANKYDAIRGIAYWLQHGHYDHGLGGGTRLDWLVIGGESGAGARPCHVEWVRSLVRQGTEAGVPVFVKQLGANPWGTWLPHAPDLRPLDRIGWANRLMHPKGGNPANWPEDLRVRQMPKGR